MDPERPRLTRKQARLVSRLIDGWRDAGTVTPDTAERLLASFRVSAFDWKYLASISLLVSALCMAVAVGSLLADEMLLELLERLFESPAWAKCLFFTFIAATLYAAGFRRRISKPRNVFSNEVLLLLGVFSTAAAVFFFGAAIGDEDSHFSLLLLLAGAIYGGIGIWARSKLVWVFALLSLGGWLGAETGYLSGWGVYYLGMNYPLRFVPFALVLCGVAHAFTDVGRLRLLAQSTLAMGLLYLFIALWILSIVGNLGDEETWRKVAQIELFQWSVLFAAASAVAIWHGLKFDDALSRGFGITFLFINLFTRYFEHFWEPLHKAVFFAILGVVLWFLGSRAQRIWNLGRRPRASKEG